jgi:CRISPR/Cas system-associated protein Csm6
MNNKILNNFVMLNPEDYEDEILEKLISFFEERGEEISDKILEDLAIEIYNAFNA